MSRPAARLTVRGRVQGVGYRWWAVEQAERLGLAGWVRNRRDGSVEILAIGDPSRISALESLCREGPRHAQPHSVERAPAQDDGSAGFIQRPTE